MGYKNSILILLAVIGVFAGAAWYVLRANLVIEDQGCTLEAKMCPDGTAVGRSGPNCEFAPCPGESDTMQKEEGHISGMVAIGPICPVEREGVPCPVPPEAYTSRVMVVYAKNGSTVVAREPIHPDGTFSFALQPGSYVLDMERSGIDHSRELPYAFTLRSGETVKHDISIDTGIR